MAMRIVDPWLLALLIAGVWLSRRRGRQARGDWRRPAWMAGAAVIAYVFANIAISAQAVGQAYAAVPNATMIVANPTPLTFWRREVLVRTRESYGSYDSVPFLALKRRESAKPIGMDDPRIAERVQHSPEARAFLFWSRMPVAESRGDRIILRDQRFMGVTASNFSVELAP
jgi:inner membrane protein